MKPDSLSFKNVRELAVCIARYFTYIEGEYHLEEVPVKSNSKSAPEETQEQKVWDRPAEPPTLSGLAHYLGFESRQDFERCERKGKYAPLLKRARLQIEAEYEKKLHYQSSTGAIFALKNLGWSEKTTTDDMIRTLKIQITETGPAPAGNERDVVLGAAP
jgi:hypothetical protein